MIFPKTSNNFELINSTSYKNINQAFSKTNMCAHQHPKNEFRTSYQIILHMSVQ